MEIRLLMLTPCRVLLPFLALLGIVGLVACGDDETSTTPVIPDSPDAAGGQGGSGGGTGGSGTGGSEAGVPDTGAGGGTAGSPGLPYTVLPWTEATSHPVRYAPLLLLRAGFASSPANAAEAVAPMQRKYEQWKAAGVWQWVNQERKHGLALFNALYNWSRFYSDPSQRPGDPTEPDDAGYTWELLDAMLSLDGVVQDDVKIVIRINWHHWGRGTPDWLVAGQGVENGEDNGLGGAILFDDSTTTGLPAFHRVYVQKEFRAFAEAFGKRYGDQAALAGVVFDEHDLQHVEQKLPSDFDRSAYLLGLDTALLDFAGQMPETPIVIYQVWDNLRRGRLKVAQNIGYGCADARLWGETCSANGPWYPDDPVACAQGYYVNAQEFSIASTNPSGGSRHIYMVGAEFNGWRQTAPIPDAAGDDQNILGFPAGTNEPCHEIEPDAFMQYHAAVPRKPGAVAGLNSVPGVIHASWLELTDLTDSTRCATGPVPRTMSDWAAAFAKLGPEGIDAALEEPLGWDDQIAP